MPRRIPKLSSAVVTASILAPLTLWVGHEIAEGRAARAELAALSGARAASTLRGVTPTVECEAQVDTRYVCTGAPEDWRPALEEALEPVAAEPELEPEAGAKLRPGELVLVDEDQLVLEVGLSATMAIGDTWGPTEGDMLNPSSPYVAQRRTSLPSDAGWDALERETFVLYGREGEVCRVRLAQPWLRVEVEGELDLLDLGGDDESPMSLWELEEKQLEGGRLTRAEKLLVSLARERLFFEGSPTLVADFERISGDCEGAIWGRWSELPRAALWTPRAGDAAELRTESRSVWRAVRRDEAYAETKAAYEEEVAAQDWMEETWEEHLKGTKEVQWWTRPGGTHVAFASMGWEGSCGEVDTLVQREWSEGELGTSVGPADAVVEFEGRTFVLTSRGSDASVYERSETGYDYVGGYEVDFYGCPC